MRLPLNEMTQGPRARGARPFAGPRARGARPFARGRASWTRVLCFALCIGALGSGACESNAGSSPADDDGDDTDVTAEEAMTPSEADDDDGDPPENGDAGAKADGKVMKPSTPPRDSGTPIDSGARIDSGAVTVDPDPGDGAVTSGDAGQMPSGPLTLPTSDKLGPYEVVIVENVGKGFENPPTAADDKGDGSGCTRFVQGFGETPEAARDYALFGPDYKVDLYTLYYPKNMVEGQLYPVLSWANGTCAKTNGYNALLSHLTSHGFIVIATNSRYTGSGKFQLRGVDYVFAENENAMSPLYKRVDTKQVGLFGHSQGGGSTWTAATDPRVKTSVILNMVASGTRPTPSFFVTGDKDLFSVSSALNAARAQKAGAALGLHKIPGNAPAGHITLMKEPERVNPSVTAWFRYQLLGDEEGKSWFVGDDCKLCNQPEEWDFVAKGLE